MNLLIQPSVTKKQSKRWLLAAGYAAAVLGTVTVILLFIILGLTTGDMQLTIKEVLSALVGVPAQPEHDLVLFQFRLPRIVLGALIGIVLGMSGAAVQSLTRNPLADPGILGIHAGAGMFVVLFMFVFQELLPATGTAAMMLMPIFGIVGGLLAAMMIFVLARKGSRMEPQRLVLVGIAVTTGFSAVTLYISLKMNPHDFERAASWLSGNLNSANWLFIGSMLPWLLLLIPYLLCKTHLLDLLRLGDTSLLGLGVFLQRERKILLFASVGLVAAGVAVAGSVGFVGLIAPHMAMRLTGLSHRRSLPMSGLLGAALVLVSDFIGRTVFSPAQLPVGVVLSIVGVPYFVWLLWSQARR
ncbi:Iron-uptake system permease protein FeuC [compost metagenome]